MDFSHNDEQHFLDTSILDEFLTPNIIEDINNGVDFGNDPDFDKILNMLNDNDIKDPIEELNYGNCNYYYPINDKTPSSTSSDSGRYSPTSIDSHDSVSNFHCSQQNSSSVFYNSENGLGYSNSSPSSLSDINNSEYIPSPTTTNASYFSQETGSLYENTSMNLPSYLPQHENNVNNISTQHVNTNSVSNVVVLNPVKILHPGSIQLQPIQVLSQQQPQVCFVLDSDNKKVQPSSLKTVNFSKNLNKPLTKDLLVSQSSSKLTVNQVPVNESNSMSFNNIDESESEFIRKREERKAKNRMAAHISRQRKKIEFNEMQNKLRLVEEENIYLKKENLKLKSQIFELEKENESLRCPSEYKPYHKKAKLGAFTAVCMIGLICTFQFTNYFQSSQIHLPMPVNNFKALTTQQRGLQIKEISNDEGRFIRRMGRSLSIKNNTKDMHLIKNTVKSFNQTKFTNCSQFHINDLKVFHLNASEKNKINDELSFWFDKHEKVYEKEESIFFDGMKNFKKKFYNDVLNSGRTMKKKVKKIIGEKESNYPLSLPKVVKKNILNTLVDAMKRRNDTIYVMPKKNYYLLPAINRDNNTVPKMSLLIPSERISNTKSKSEITMLKIECEIVGTEYFNVPKSLFNYDSSNDGRPGFI